MPWRGLRARLRRWTNNQATNTMKKAFIGLVCLLALTAIAGIVGSQQVIQTCSDSAVPVRITTNHLKMASMTIIGNKAARTANTGTVYIGPTSANDTQAIPITTGQILTFVAPPGQNIDLFDYWLDVTTAGDGVVIVITPAN